MRRMLVGWLMLCMLSTAVAASPDAAAGYLKAFEALPAEDSEVLLLLSKDEWTDGERQSFLAATQTSMDLLVDASRQPFEGWGTPSPMTPATELPYLDSMRTLSRVAHRHITDRVSAGRLVDAMELIGAVDQLGHAVDHDDVISCRFVAIGIRMGAIEAFMGYLPTLEPAKRQTLAQTLGKHLSHEKFEAVVMADFELVIQYVLDAKDDEIKERAGLTKDDHAEAIALDTDEWRRQLRRLRLREPEVRRIFSGPLQQQLDRARALDASIRWIGPFAEAMSPGYELLARNNIFMTIDSLALAAACDVIDRGDAAIQDHIDPTTGKPFVLRRESETVFEIHSGLRMKEAPFGWRVGDPSRSRTWE